MSAGVAAPTEKYSLYEKYKTDLQKDEAPSYVTYPYVLRGYRAGGNYKRCTAALFELHTETMNAWTMIAGGVVSIAMLSWVTSATQQSVTALIPFLALTSAVLLHMPFSVGFHLFRGIGPDVYNLWRRLDQIFIFLVSILLAFGLSWHVYDTWIGITINTAAAAGVAAFGIRDLWGLPPQFQRNRTIVVIFFGCIVMCYWFPMGYQAGKELSEGQAGPCTVLAFATFAALQLGGWIFAAGFPEKWFPCRFDVWFFSHPLMHVFAVVAHVLEYLFVWELHQRTMLQMT